MTPSLTDTQREPITIVLDGWPLRVPAGTTVAAALALQAAPGASRVSVSGEVRAPFCGMGICHECRVSIGGRRRLACQTPCRDGMQVLTDVPREQAP